MSSFDDLSANKSKAQGKIVVFNAPFTTYGETVQYRINGADAASAVNHHLLLYFLFVVVKYNVYEIPITKGRSGCSTCSLSDTLFLVYSSHW